MTFKLDPSVRSDGECGESNGDAPTESLLNEREEIGQCCSCKNESRKGSLIWEKFSTQGNTNTNDVMYNNLGKTQTLESKVNLSKNIIEVSFYIHENHGDEWRFSFKET